MSNITNDIPGYLFAAVVAGGGAMGYVKKGSVPSLAAGGVSGLLLAYGASRVSRNPRDVKLSLSVSALLLVLMGSRFVRGGKFMPAGLVSLLSLIMVFRYAQRL